MFNGMYKMVVNYLFYIDKTLIVGIVTIISALLNIALNLILIDFYGLKGAAIATLITLLFQFISVFVFAQKYFPMPWFDNKLFQK
jgi:O-antigen/teichoic acid export membrane protein